MVRVLFVCLGNICRSPTAEAVMRAKLKEAALDELIVVDSAGTGDWHIGKPADERATRVALQRGYDLSPLRARQVCHADFALYDLILAMDSDNLRDLENMATGLADHKAKLERFLAFHPSPPFRDVPDPYYGEGRGFQQVLDLIEVACDGLIESLREQWVSSEAS